MRASSQIALKIVLEDWNPRLSTVQYATDYGSLQYSYGADKDIVSIYSGGCGFGAGGAVSLNLFPSVPAWITDEHRQSFTPSAAIRVATASSALLADPTSGDLDWSRWEAGTLAHPLLANAHVSLDSGDASNAALAVAGMDLPNDGDRSGFYIAIAALEKAGRNAEASLLCTEIENLQCAGVNAYLAGDYQIAAKALNAKVDENHPHPELHQIQPDGDYLDGPLILQAAEAA
jgi:hypothetical protein